MLVSSFPVISYLTNREPNGITSPADVWVWICPFSEKDHIFSQLKLPLEAEAAIKQTNMLPDKMKVDARSSASSQQRGETNLCALWANDGEVSSYSEHEVFYLGKVVDADAWGLVH